jgi:hypothetical protein
MKERGQWMHGPAYSEKSAVFGTVATSTLRPVPAALRHGQGELNGLQLQGLARQRRSAGRDCDRRSPGWRDDAWRHGRECSASATATCHAQERKHCNRSHVSPDRETSSRLERGKITVPCDQNQQEHAEYE